jgi:hypothetical protein
VLFRNNFALSRDITGLFQSFQSSSTVLDPAANPSLFQSTLVIIIKVVLYFLFDDQPVAYHEITGCSRFRCGRDHERVSLLVRRGEFYKILIQVVGQIQPQVSANRANRTRGKLYIPSAQRKLSHHPLARHWFSTILLLVLDSKRDVGRTEYYPPSGWYISAQDEDSHGEIEGELMSKVKFSYVIVTTCQTNDWGAIDGLISLSLCLSLSLIS